MGEPKTTEETNLVAEIADLNPNPEHSYFQQERHRILFSAIHELKPEMRLHFSSVIFASNR
jgi:hypothetical protein